MASSGTVGIVLAVLALLLASGGLVLASQPQVYSPPEQSATCTTMQYAQNESSAGLFQCSQPQYNQLANLCSNSPTSGNFTMYSKVIGAQTFEYPIYHYDLNGVSNSIYPSPCVNTNVRKNSIVRPEVISHTFIGNQYEQLSASPLTYGLVGYWPLDEGSGTSAYDLSGNNYTMAVVSGATWSSYFNAGLTSATNQLLTVTATPALVPSSGTIGCWIHIGSTLIGSYSITCIWGYNAAYTAFFKTDAASHFCFNVQFASSTSTACDSSTFSINTSYFTVGTWNYTGSATNLDIYVNGSSVGTASSTSEITTPCSAPTCGPQLYGNANTIIAYFSLYNYALTPSEISELYHASIPNLEHQVTASGQSLIVRYYQQIPQTVSSGSKYESLGVNYTSSVTGTYWVDTNTVNAVSQSSYNQNTCSISSTSTLMAGLGVSFTAVTDVQAITLNFQIASPAASAPTSSYQIAYGTSATSCAGAASGTPIGNPYKIGTTGSSVGYQEHSITGVISGLTVGTKYYVDLQVTDSTTSTWTYSSPYLTVFT